MSARIRVTAAELRDLWMTPEAVGMIHDHSASEVGIQMMDGTEYACTFAEKAAFDAAGDRS